VSFNHEPDPVYRCFRSSTAISAAPSSGPSRAKVLLVGWQLRERPQAVWLSWVIELLSKQPAGTAASPASAAAITTRGVIGPGVWCRYYAQFSSPWRS
jgi:hypothetical protein